MELSLAVFSVNRVGRRTMRKQEEDPEQPPVLNLLQDIIFSKCKHFTLLFPIWKKQSISARFPPKKGRGR